MSPVDPSISVDALIALCQDLVRVPSPSGGEAAVAERVQAAMRANGCDDVVVDPWGNVIGRWQGQEEGPPLLFDAHMDTVPVADPDRWQHDPYGGAVVDGRLYGRGAADMKGALAAMIHAMGRLVAAGRRPRRDVYVSATVAEELFEGVALVPVLERVRPGLVVIGEASELNLKIGQRGRAEIVVTTAGKSCHSSSPEKGENAIYKMAEAIGKLRAMPPPVHPELGPGISEVTDIISSPYPGASVVPDRCRVTIDRRLLLVETPESVLAAYEAVLGDAAAVAIAESSLTCYTGETLGGRRFFPAWMFDRDHPVIHDALAALAAAGLRPEITTYRFCTNGSASAGRFGILTVGFGPGAEHLAHIDDEYIPVADLAAAAAGYREMAAVLAP